MGLPQRSCFPVSIPTIAQLLYNLPSFDHFDDSDNNFFILPKNENNCDNSITTNTDSIDPNLVLVSTINIIKSGCEPYYITLLDGQYSKYFQIINNKLYLNKSLAPSISTTLFVSVVAKNVRDVVISSSTFSLNLVVSPCVESL